MAQGWKGTLAAMLAGGAVGLFLAPIVAPALGRATRPTAKAAIKAGIALYQRGLETAAELREAFEDVSAEIAAESAARHGAPMTEAASDADMPAPATKLPQAGAAIH